MPYGLLLWVLLMAGSLQWWPVWYQVLLMVQLLWLQPLIQHLLLVLLLQPTQRRTRPR